MDITFPTGIRARTPDEPVPDLTDYTVVHRAMRVDIRRLADTVDGVVNGATTLTADRARALRDYLAAVSGEIESHHRIEDDYVWPVLVSVAAHPADLAGLTRDHDELDPLLGRAGTLASALAAGPPERRVAADLAATLNQLSDLLDRHILDEEREIFPLIRDRVRVRDYQWLQARFRGNVRPGLLPFLVPWAVRHATPEEARHMLAEAPWVFSLLLRMFRGGFARRERLIFG